MVLTKDIFKAEACDVEIPEYINDQPVAEIDNAFSGNTELRSVVIPKTVVKINRGAFAGCSNLEKVTFSGNITDYGFSCFSGTKIKEIELPDGAETIPEEMFKNCVELEDVTLPDTLLSIGMVSFIGCKALKEIVIPESVTEIHNCAFADCDNLEDVFIKGSIVKIAELTFENCPKIKVHYRGRVYPVEELSAITDRNFF